MKVQVFSTGWSGIPKPYGQALMLYPYLDEITLMPTNRLSKVTLAPKDGLDIDQQTARKLLGVKPVCCPNAGKKPSFGGRNSGWHYMYHRAPNWDHQITGVSCSVCGLCVPEMGDPNLDRHPEVEYFPSEPKNWETDIGFDTQLGCFIESSKPGRLAVVWSTKPFIPRLSWHMRDRFGDGHMSNHEPEPDSYGIHWSVYVPDYQPSYAL